MQHFILAAHLKDGIVTLYRDGVQAGGTLPRSMLRRQLRGQFVSSALSDEQIDRFETVLDSQGHAQVDIARVLVWLEA